MNDTPKLTDRAALLRHRDRARRQGRNAWFLHELATIEVQETLEMVNKSFPRAGIVTGFGEIWQRDFPGATCIADKDVLGFDEASLDLIIHGLALHWANDPVGQLIQCRRALVPDGFFFGVTFGGETLHELRIALAEAEAEVTGGAAPRIVPMGDVRDFGQLLQRSGFAMPVADVTRQSVAYRDILHLMHDLQAMGEANALAKRHKAPLRRAVLARAQEIYETHFPDETGGLRATFDLITLAGWAPDASQPKPLRPGSATARLGDFLGTDELKLPRD